MTQHREDGTIALLSLGLLAVVIIVVAAVVDVSAVFLARRDLAGACDSAALAGAQALDPTELYRNGVTATLPVSASSGGAAAAQIARTVGEGTTARATVTGATVTVDCTRVVSLPLGDLVGAGTFIVRAQSSAQSPVR